MAKRLAFFGVSVVLAAAALVPTGCSSSGPRCRSVSVHVPSPQVADIKGAFDVSATVTAAGKPVAGLSVQFWGWGRPPGQSSEVGTSLGAAVTGADGTATLHMPPEYGADGVISSLRQLSGNEFVKVSADVAAATVGGQAYCVAKESAAVTCGRGGCTVS